MNNKDNTPDKDNKQWIDNNGNKIVPQVTGNQFTKAPEQTDDKQLIINNIVMRSVDRTPKDIGDWNLAYTAATSIYYPIRTRLYDIYDYITSFDGHLTGIKKRRISGISNKKVRYVNANKEDIEQCETLLESLEFNRLKKEILEHFYWGISGVEFVPGKDFKIKIIPKKHIKPEWGIIAVNQNDYSGILYDDIWNIMVFGEQRDLGVLCVCAFYSLLKKGAISDWANYVEIFGNPMIIFKYDQWDGETKKKLEQLLDNVGNSMRMSIPKQSDFEILDGKSSSNGNGDLQRQFVETCDEQMSIALLGVTETTKSSRTSGYGQSQTHQTEQNEIQKDDLNYLISTLNSEKFKAILSTYGFPADGKFIVEEEMAPEKQLIKAQTLFQLSQIGLPLNHDQIYEDFGLYKPDDYDDQIAAKLAAQTALINNPPEPDGDEPPTPEKGKEVKPGNKGNKPNKTKQPANAESLYFKVRSAIADFFDPAHKD